MRFSKKSFLALVVLGLVTAVGLRYVLRTKDARSEGEASKPSAVAGTSLPAVVQPAPVPEPARKEQGHSQSLPPTADLAGSIPPVSLSAGAATEPDTAAPATSAASKPLSPTELATDRMIVAHAPLREPAVANPDSPENRQALQSMLQKALLRKDAKPPVLVTP